MSLVIFLEKPGLTWQSMVHVLDKLGLRWQCMGIFSDKLGLRMQRLVNNLAISGRFMMAYMDIWTRSGQPCGKWC